MIGGLTGIRSREDLLATLEAVGVPAGPINSVADALHDPQAVHRAMVVKLPHDGVEEGYIPSVRTPILIDGEPMVALRASPDLGDWERGHPVCSLKRGLKGKGRKP